MCTSIALTISELPVGLIESAGLSDRVFDRGGEKEVRFDWRSIPAVLPVRLDGRLQIVRWGNRDRLERSLPLTGWTWRATVESGRWSSANVEPVEVAVSYGYANGVWYRVSQGMQGLLVRARSGEPVVYLICEPSTRYYRVMTRSEWMPVLIGEVI